MGSPEAVCERAGTLMHMQWESTRHVNAGALVDEVLTREAKVCCIGHPRDEMICRQVAKAMFALGRRPIVGSRHRDARSDACVVTSRPIDRVRLVHKSSLDESGRHGHVCASSGEEEGEEEEEEEEEEDDDAESGADAMTRWSTLSRLHSDLCDRTRRAEPSLQMPKFP